MPSRGNALCHFCASSEYSTFFNAESASRTSTETTKRAPSRPTVPIVTDGGVLSMSKLALSSSPTEREFQRVRDGVGRDHLQDVGAVRRGRGVPHGQGVGEAGLERAPRGLALAPIQHAVAQLVLVLVFGLPRDGLHAALIDSPPQRGAAALRSASALVGEPAFDRLFVQPGNLRFAGRERLLERDARRMHGDRLHARPHVALQVSGRDRGEERASPLRRSARPATAGSAPWGC